MIKRLLGRGDAAQEVVRSLGENLVGIKECVKLHGNLLSACLEEVLSKVYHILEKKNDIPVGKGGFVKNVLLDSKKESGYIEKTQRTLNGRGEGFFPPAYAERRNTMRIGSGYDVHKLVEGRDCIIGGVKIPYEKGLLGHSDADVLLHAISDALLGAAALGDIGKHFPDTDLRFKGADSRKLLSEVLHLISAKGYCIINIDATIIAQKPKMAPHIEQMRENIAETLELNVEQVNVKATTEEGLGFTGAGLGIAASAVCLLDEK